MVVYMLSLLARNGEVQTAAVRWLAAEVSQALHADIDVRHVEYRFFNTLHIDDIYISDQQGDTLAYVGSADVQLRARDLLHKKVSIRKLAIDRPYVNLHDDNYAFLVRALQSGDTTKNDSLRFPVRIDDVQVTHVRARLDSLLLADAELQTGLLSMDDQGISMDIRSMRGKVLDGRHADSSGIQPTTLFELCELQAELMANDSTIDLPHLYVRLPHSQLNSEVVHIDRESFTLRLSDTYFSGRDFALFVPQVQKEDGQIGLTASLEGNRDSVMLSDLNVSYKGIPMLRGAATVYEWQDYDSLQLRVECQDLLVRAAMLQDFIADILDHPYQLPPIVSRLGEMHYKGTLEGRLRDMNLHGNFRTALGVISTNGHAQTNAQFDDLSFVGAIGTKRFQLGRLLNNADLGAVTLNMQVNGHTAKNHPVHGKFRGRVQQLAYKGYNYTDIQLDGQFEHESIEGSLSSNDPNIQLALSGLVDLSENAPNINVTLELQHLRLDALNLTDKLSDSDIQMKLYVNFSGTDIDHINGYLVLDSLLFANNGDTLNMRQLKITAESETDDPTRHNLRLESDYIVGRIAGHFKYPELGTSVQKMVVQYVPHLFDARMRQRLEAQSTTQATFYLYAHDLDKILDVLPVNISQSGSLTIKGMIDEPRQIMAVSGVVPELVIGKQQISDIILSADNRDNRINLRSSAHINLPDTMGIGDADLIMNVMAMNDSVLLTLDLSNDAEQMYGGQVGLLTTFAEYASKPIITANVMPSELLVADQLWYIDPARLVYSVADTALQVEHLWIGNEQKHIFADGVASTSMEDSIHVKLKNIDLSAILGLTPIPEFTLTAQGLITGTATLYGILSSLQLNADLHIADAGLNGHPIGEIDAWAKLDNVHKAVEIGGEVIDNGRHAADLNGLITPMDDKTWSLHIYPDSLNLGFLNHWTKAFLHDINGRGSGHVHVFGRQKHTWVTTEAVPHNVSIKVPFTGVTYYVNDSIYMDSTSIRFPHHTLYDREKHPVRLDGVVKHRNFQKFSFDINMFADNAIVLDLPNSSTAAFYGKVYGTGDTHLFGDEKKVNLTAHAKSNAGSTFHLNIGGQSDAKENSFITFVDHSAPKVLTKHRTKRNPNNSTNLDLDLFVTVDQGTQFFTQFGNNSDDMLRGRGEGSMRVHLINSDLQLQGTLTLRQGNLTYALGNMVHRDFSISDGSSITWQGSPMDMNLDVTAKYHVVASLKDLFGSDLSSLQTNRTSVPVNCVIYLKDNILNPILSFGIELPQSDETVQSQVRSFINSEEMLMREVLYLLVFNRFFTPEYLRSTNSTGLNETYSLLSSTVTGQINSWLSKLTNIVTFGINFRTDGEGAEASQEYEAQISIQPIDGLLINGNVGYRYNDLNNRPVFGDLDIEYIITPDGMLRVKGYTHTVDKYSLRQANMVEGVGFVVKHDFNWGDASRNEERKRKQKEEKQESQK